MERALGSYQPKHFCPFFVFVVHTVYTMFFLVILIRPFIAFYHVYVGVCVHVYVGVCVHVYVGVCVHLLYFLRPLNKIRTWDQQDYLN